MILSVLALAMMPNDGVIGKGSGLYEQCKTYIAVTEPRSTANGRLEWMKAGICMGYVRGVTEASYPLHIMCPSESTLPTFIRVYIAFMDKNPKFRDQPQSEGLVSSLVDAYPCPAK